MFCYNCGTKLPQNESLCFQCGTTTVVPQAASSQSMQCTQHGEKRLDVGVLVLSLIGWILVIIFPAIALPCFVAGIVLALLRRNTKNTTATLALCSIGFAFLIIAFILQGSFFIGFL